MYCSAYLLLSCRQYSYIIYITLVVSTVIPITFIKTIIIITVGTTMKLYYRQDSNKYALQYSLSNYYIVFIYYILFIMARKCCRDLRQLRSHYTEAKTSFVRAM